MSESVETLSTGRPWATGTESANGPDPAVRQLLDGIQLLVRRFAIAERADVQCCGLTVAQSATLEVLRAEGPRGSPRSAAASGSRPRR